MVALSRPKLPQAGLGQRIATIALLLLALIAAIALLSRGSGEGSSPGASRSPFTAQSYGTSSSASDGAGRSTSSSAASSTATRTDAPDDGLETVRLAQLPREARATVALIDDGGPYPYRRDGVVFGNRERILPRQASGWYHEYTVRTPGSSDRGARRIVTGKDGTMYYTDDHYETFRRVVR